MKRIDTQDLIGKFVKVNVRYGIVIGSTREYPREIMLIYLFDNDNGNDRIMREFPHLTLNFVENFLDSMKEV